MSSKRKSSLIGRVYKSKYGEEAEIIEILPNRTVLVRFLETGQEEIKWIANLRKSTFSSKAYKEEAAKRYSLRATHSLLLYRVVKGKNYIDSSIQSGWEDFNSFYSWAKLQKGHDKDSWQLDKDILQKGNKNYSEDLCCFVPLEINVAFTKSNKKRGQYPIGVSKRGDKYVAQVGGTKNKVYLGSYGSPEEAFVVYKKAKEDNLKSLAEKYKIDLDPRVYNAIVSYEVEITD